MKTGDSMTRKTSIGMGAVGVVIMMISGIFAALNMMSIPVHHLVHAVMALGAGMFALAMAESSRHNAPNAACGLFRQLLHPSLDCF